MSAFLCADDHAFCRECGTLLPQPGATDIVECNRCGYRMKLEGYGSQSCSFAEFFGVKVTTRSRQYAFQKPKVQIEEREKGTLVSFFTQCLLFIFRSLSFKTRAHTCRFKRIVPSVDTMKCCTTHFNFGLLMKGRQFSTLVSTPSAGLSVSKLSKLSGTSSPSILRTASEFSKGFPCGENGVPQKASCLLSLKTSFSFLLMSEHFFH